MKRKSIQKINFSSDQDRQNKVTSYKKHMPIVRCICGSEILVVPDLKAMNIAITKHVGKPKKVHNDLERLTEFLTEQVLITASKINLANTSWS
jgi:hypothetical protein